MEQWGRDHWSTLLYVETRCVDHQGYLHDNQMRTFRYGYDGNHPTRLKDGTFAPEGHDDWACLFDMMREKLISSTVLDTGTVYSLTDRGWKIAAALRRHYAESNRNPNTFNPPEEIVNDVQ